MNISVVFALLHPPLVYINKRSFGVGPSLLFHFPFHLSQIKSNWLTIIASYINNYFLGSFLCLYRPYVDLVAVVEGSNPGMLLFSYIAHQRCTWLLRDIQAGMSHHTAWSAGEQWQRDSARKSRIILLKLSDFCLNSQDASTSC
jgi:hypothetical protein